MNISIDRKCSSKVAIAEGIFISDVQGALDVMAEVKYNHDCNKLLIDKSGVKEDFFELSTGLAGAILQKYMNYHFKLAIVGDFDGYDSKSLKDFIRESNQGRQVFFLKDKQAAIGGYFIGKNDFRYNCFFAYYRSGNRPRPGRIQ